MRKLMGASAAVLLLTACGSEQDGTFEAEDGSEGAYSVDASDGETELNVTCADGEEISVSSGAGVEESLPEGYSVYPGAEVVTSTTLAREGSSGAIVIMNTPDSPEDVAEYYREQAEAAGIEIMMDMNADGAIMIGGESSDGSRMFSINASSSGEVTTAHLQVGDNITD